MLEGPCTAATRRTRTRRRRDGRVLASHGRGPSVGPATVRASRLTMATVAAPRHANGNRHGGCIPGSTNAGCGPGGSVGPAVGPERTRSSMAAATALPERTPANRAGGLSHGHDGQALGPDAPRLWRDAGTARGPALTHRVRPRGLTGVAIGSRARQYRGQCHAPALQHRRRRLTAQAPECRVGYETATGTAEAPGPCHTRAVAGKVAR